MVSRCTGASLINAAVGRASITAFSPAVGSFLLFISYHSSETFIFLALHPRLEHDKVFRLQEQLQLIRLCLLPSTQVGILDFNPCQNTVHSPLHFYQIMDPIPCHYINHQCSLPPCYRNLLVSFVVGHSPALFSPNLVFLCLRDHIYRNIVNGACGNSIFFLRRCRNCTIIDVGFISVIIWSNLGIQGCRCLCRGVHSIDHHGVIWADKGTAYIINRVYGLTFFPEALV